MAKRPVRVNWPFFEKLYGSERVAAAREKLARKNMKIMTEHEKNIQVDGAFRGAALAFCLVSFVDVIRFDLLGIMWLFGACICIGLSFAIGHFLGVDD